MTFLPAVLGRQISEAGFDAKLGQWVCCLGGVAILPMAIVALVRHPGTRSDFFVGLVLAFVMALLLLMLGTLARHVDLLKIPVRARWAEFLCYLASVGVLLRGIQSLATIGGSPAQVTLGVLAVGSLSLAVLDLGMLTTVARALRTGERSGPTGAAESMAGAPVVS
ncbi:hypothetical protein [Singulisphaera acidiphila]|uniref:Uncharacterized protein n=1 Tax=Singulisphaera acidiphila (strain ATCC BAA-1392 / DSM 18658 / VKM B-2454 / MOB10) TaxID=886293 RepID=L0DGA2_SINAD|nr:hypothetical protein [Singulisphaera acidiphila]AGA27711.1 hypothetical protein Sinac_3450 [Singulisphaera acidiphila DSM 18658]